jgi:hypothetical protein
LHHALVEPFKNAMTSWVYKNETVGKVTQQCGQKTPPTKISLEQQADNNKIIATAIVD